MIIFAIVFGLSMDYEVFLLSRIREEYDRTGDNATAVADGLALTARVITAAAAIMVCVFGSFVLGPERRAQAVRPRPRGRGAHRRDRRPPGARAGDDGAARRPQLVDARSGSTGSCRACTSRASTRSRTSSPSSSARLSPPARARGSGAARPPTRSARPRRRARPPTGSRTTLESTQPSANRSTNRRPRPSSAYITIMKVSGADAVDGDRHAHQSASRLTGNLFGCLCRSRWTRCSRPSPTPTAGSCSTASTPATARPCRSSAPTST